MFGGSSGAFFLSIEFENTGFFVFTAYKVAFGNLPGKPVPVRRETFMPETRGLANGVVVGVGQWQKQLDDNKNAYALAFVQRADFVASHPTSQSAAAYVDGLFSTAGASPTTSERDAAVAAFGAGGVAGRAAALRSVADSQTLRGNERNNAFVLLQYFGYLKRNPDDLPNTDFSGYSFWLKKLNDNGGDFKRAEMVKAFISSDEYRARF